VVPTVREWIPAAALRDSDNADTVVAARAAANGVPIWVKPDHLYSRWRGGQYLYMWNWEDPNMADPRELVDAYGKQETILSAVGDPTCDGRWTPFERIAPKAFAALREVLRLHKPEEFGEPEVICTGCSDASPVEKWPCETVEAIINALT
jgi:hypothetical protein